MNLTQRLREGFKLGTAQALKTVGRTPTGFIGTAPFRIQQMLSTRGEIERLKSKKEEISPEKKALLKARTERLVGKPTIIVKKEITKTKEGAKATKEDIGEGVSNIKKGVGDIIPDMPSFPNINKTLTKYGILAIAIIGGVVLIQRGGK